MPDVGGMLASAMLKLVTQQIGSIIGGRLKLQWDFSDDLRNMEMTLESMEAVLQDAERRSIHDAAVRLWLKRLTDAMYGISDILGDLETARNLPRWKFAARMSYLAVGSKILIANKMKKMRQEVENIKNQHQQFSFKTDSIRNVQTVPDERETDSYVEDKTLIVGRTEETRKIIACFSESMAQDIIILPIYGFGGIGKTTLAKLVFNDTYFEDHSQGGKVVVIVTTRDEHIARKICTVQPYKLLPLSDETCWAIIKQKSDFEAREDKEYLEQIGRDIAMKCGGVALAAQALGYMLKPLTFGEWESVRNSDIWNASTSEQESLAHHNVLACLLLSYRTSSIFSTRQYGENYAKQLLGMSFLQHSKAGIRGAAFSSAKYLRVLDLRECYIAKLSNSIGELKQLRYLNAQGVQDKVIPRSITQLFKLNYLNLGGSLITELPESFGKMKSLMHLNLSSCLKLVKLPKSFVDLKELVHLDLHNCRNVDIVPGLLVELKELAYLDLSKCICVKAMSEDLGVLAKLQYLDLSGTFMGKKIMLGLKKGMSNLTDLRYLGISAIRGLSAVEMDGFIDCVSLLSNLEHLKLSHNREMVSLPESISSLRKLRILDLSACNNLERLPEGMFKMHCLRILKVEDCYNLDMPTLNFFGQLSNIEVQSGGDSRSHHMLGHGNPDKSLKISGLECMRFPELAHSIERMRKQRTEILELEWNRNDKASLQEDMIILEELLPPKTLRYLKLHGYYNSVSFPAWLMSISQYLPNLVEIRMWGLPKCNSLPPFGQLPNLRELFIGGMDNVTKIGEGFYGGRGAFPKLWEFELRCMENLEEWKTMYSDLEHDVQAVMSVNLDRLTLQDCLKLRLKPCPPSAKHWEIENCDNVLTLWDEGTQTCASSTTLRENTWAIFSLSVELKSHVAEASRLCRSP
ncbi:hypothetical protein HU200_055379 [Digitaria exilis]|uniref:Uncharacterized protein n=1 Tax=Digitaria exilis TaxID=1010633 RepID=A0A835E648_9POAL|nr:hypothetical protein HU200_055379 [Digitaria exilis]